MDIEKKLKEISHSYVPLPPKCLQEFISSSEIRTFKEGEIVVREGQYSKNAYLIFEGSARAKSSKNRRIYVLAELIRLAGGSYLCIKEKGILISVSVKANTAIDPGDDANDLTQSKIVSRW